MFVKISSAILVILLWLYLLDIATVLLQNPKNPTWLTKTPIAHRGLHSAQIPENSLRAFELAKKNNFAIELDVHLTKDNRVVVHHDGNLTRMTGLNGCIEKLSYADIAKLHLKDTDQTIPTLEETLQLIAGKVPLYIEIKNPSTKIGNLEKAVFDIIKNYKGALAIISFNPHSLHWYKKHAPQILRGQTASKIAKRSIHFFVRFALNHFLFNWKSRPHFIIYNIKYAPSNLVLRMLRYCKPVITYGIKNGSTYDSAKKVSDNFMFDDIGSTLQQDSKLAFHKKA